MTKGAKWWKFDFHTHTPASNDYGKGVEQRVLAALKPRDWLLTYMENEIDCVAVTDHNSGEWIDELKKELEIMEREEVVGYRPLFIFPGVEISVNSGIHLLAIFNQETTSLKIAQILAKCEYEGDFGETSSTTKKSFEEVVEIIHSKNGIAIPAHVDKEAGLFKVVTSGPTLKQNLKSQGLLAMEVIDRDFIKPQTYKDLKFNFTEVVGSDSHNPEHVGRVFTWVKMESPNFDALKLALHDGEDGVKDYRVLDNNPNDIQSRYYIKSIQIKDGAKIGRGNEDFNIDFSPWFTTLIGGRGSGKSTVIEFIRMVLGRQSELPKTMQSEFNEFKKIAAERGESGMLLETTEVVVDIFKDSRDIRLIWKGNEIFEYEKSNSGEWEPQGVSTNIEKRFPVRLFSQKQLFEMTKDSNLIISMVDSNFNKSRWKTEREELTKKWKQGKLEQRSLSLKINTKRNLEVELKDINNKLRLYEEMGHAKLLQNYQNVTSVINFLDNFKLKIGEQADTLKTFMEDFKLQVFPPEIKILLDDISIEQIEKNITQWNELFILLETYREKVESIQETMVSTIESIPWNTEKDEIINKYNEFTTKLAETGEKNTDSYSNLVKRKQEIQLEKEKLIEFESQFQDVRNMNNKIFEEIMIHEKNLRTQRKTIISEWNSKNNNLKIILNELGNSTQADASFRKIIRREGRTFMGDIYEPSEADVAGSGLISEITNAVSDPWNKRNEVIRGLLNEDEFKQGNYTKRFQNYIKELRENSVEDIDDLIIWFPEDDISLKLITGTKEENIEIGSAGERTAAMLSLLLSIDDTPLIIDQPEDDLDTKRITDLVVKGLRKLKEKQQIIVVTHNPNIPVNGSAEMIVQMNFVKGMIKVKSAGALQETDVRKAVCDVMEGGREALNNRYYRVYKALSD